MKIIVIGLGSFGSIVSVRLTELGHEVIGVDTSMERVEELKTKLSTAICLDSSNVESLSVLPISEVDLIVVAIGMDFAASVQSVAALRQSGAKRIIARTMSPLHTGVLQTLGVERVVFVEKDSAELFSQSLSLNGFISSYRVDAEHYVVQFTAPKSLVGKMISQTEIESGFNMQVITIKRSRQVKNLLGLVHSERAVMGVPTPEMVIEDGDIIVVYGRLRDYDTFTRSMK